MPFDPVGAGQQRRSVVRQQVDVGLDRFGRGLAEGEDPERDPRVRGRDRDVDRRAVADLLPAGLGRIGVERRGQEDRAPLRVEVEHLGGVGGEAEAMGGRPFADGVAPPLRTVRSSASIFAVIRTWAASSAAADAAGDAAESRTRARLADQALEGPVAALHDARRDAGQGSDRAELAAAAGELEGGDVVLDAVVIARERRRPEQVDCAVRSDQAAAGEGRGGRQEDRQRRPGQAEGQSPSASARVRPVELGSPHRIALRAAGRIGSAWLRLLTPAWPTRFPRPGLARCRRAAASGICLTKAAPPGCRPRAPRPGCRGRRRSPGT